MNIKAIFMITMFLGITFALRRRIIPQVQKPTTLVVIQNVAAPEPTVKEPEENPTEKKKPYCRMQLINPPPAVELPCGLGYFPSVLPLVAQSFDPEFDTCDKELSLPISSSMTIAAPLCPEYDYLVKSIIL